MGKLAALIQMAAICYVAFAIYCRSFAMFIVLLVVFAMEKVHTIGCWKYKSKNKHLPFVWYQPFFGSIAKIQQYMQQDDYHERAVAEYHRLIQQTKEPILVYGGPAVNGMPCYFYQINDPKIIKYIFEDHFEDFVKGSTVYDALEELLGDGIFAVDPPQWQFHRKVASRMFSMRNLKDYMFDCAKENVVILIDKMLQLSDHTSRSSELDVFELFGRFTLQSFLQTAFGERLPIIESLPSEHSFCSAFDRILSDIYQRFLDPLWKIKRYLGIGQREGIDIPRDTKILDDFCARIINDRNKRQHIVDESGLDRYDLLSLFLKHGGIQNKDMNEKLLRDITLNFVVAARDTTRILLSWFFYEITKQENEHILSRILQEIDAHREEELTYDDSCPYLGGGGGTKTQQPRKYQYLEAVVCEVLRLHPPVTFLTRSSTRDQIQVPYRTMDGKDRVLRFCKGDGVTVYTNAYLRLPSIWGTNGRDPHKIHVDNLYATGINTFSPYIFPVFNLSPRMCLGKTSALMQAKIVIISLLRRFQIQAVEDQTVTAGLSPLLLMKNGFKVRFKQRSA